MKTTLGQQTSAIQSEIFNLLTRRHEIITKETNKNLSDEERADLVQWIDDKVTALQDAQTVIRTAYRAQKEIRAFLALEWVQEEPEEDKSDE